jgi:hypothetical protein
LSDAVRPQRLNAVKPYLGADISPVTFVLATMLHLCSR